MYWEGLMFPVNVQDYFSDLVLMRLKVNPSHKSKVPITTNYKHFDANLESSSKRKELLTA